MLHVQYVVDANALNSRPTDETLKTFIDRGVEYVLSSQSNSCVSSKQNHNLSFFEQYRRRLTLHLSSPSLIAYSAFNVFNAYTYRRDSIEVRGACCAWTTMYGGGLVSRFKSLSCKSISNEVINMAPTDIYLPFWVFERVSTWNGCTENCVLCVHKWYTGCLMPYGDGGNKCVEFSEWGAVSLGTESNFEFLCLMEEIIENEWYSLYPRFFLATRHGAIL